MRSYVESHTVLCIYLRLRVIYSFRDLLTEDRLYRISCNYKEESRAIDYVFFSYFPEKA